MCFSFLLGRVYQLAAAVKRLLSDKLHLGPIGDLTLAASGVVVIAAASSFLVAQPGVLSDLASRRELLPVAAGAEEGLVEVDHGGIVVVGDQCQGISFSLRASCLSST